MSSANNNDGDTTQPCSYCKREVAVANFMLHEAHCMRHIALCPQCKEPVPKTQLKEHIAQEHSKVPCALCEKEFERHELEDHKANNCRQRPVTCQYCEIELPMSKMQEHEDACGSRTEKCVTCHSYIMIKNAEEHKMSNCRPPEEEQDWDSEEERPRKFGYVDECDGYPANKHKMSNCTPPEKEQDWYSEEERPRKFGYVDEYDGYPANKHKMSNYKPPEKEQDWDSVVGRRHKFGYVEEYDGFPVNEFDGQDDMVPCEFCGMPFPFDYLIQHESGCDQNAMLGNASSAPAHQPRQVYPREDVHEDGTRNTVPELKKLNINPSAKERKNVVENSREPEEQEHSRRLPSKQKIVPDRAAPPTIQTEKSTVEKMKIDKSKNNLDSESAHSGTSTVKENYASDCDVIPCEFCDSPIELTLLMEHQKMCRWVHSNKAFRQEPHFAVNGENEDDFDESPTRYQHHFQRGRGYASPSRGYTNGNTKWTSERNSQAANTSKYPYPEKRSYREVEKNPDSASETSSSQTRSQGPSGYRSYRQEDRRQTYAEDEPLRYKGRMDSDRNSEWQREEQNKVRPLMEFDMDDARQEGQREEKRAARQQREDNRWSTGQQARQQREDNRWSTGQQGQRGKPSEGRQVRNENPRAPREEVDVPAGKRPESANLRLEGRIGVAEQQEKGPGHQPQRKEEQVGVGQRWTRGAEGEDEVVTGVQPEEENWRGKRPTDGQVRARSSRGRGGRSGQNHSNARSIGAEEENETAEEPTANARTPERTRGGQTRQNQRHDEGREARPRNGDDHGPAWSGRRGHVRGQYNWRRERWNRTKGQAEVDCYNAPWPRKSNRDQNE